MSLLPLLVFVVLAAGFIAFSARARRRQAAALVAQSEQIEVGTDVMTTSGLHGTVVAKNGDGSVQMSIAPGVEVRWEIAALRDAAALPPQFGRAGNPGADDDADEVGPSSVDRPIRLEKDDSSRGTDPTA